MYNEHQKRLYHLVAVLADLLAITGGYAAFLLYYLIIFKPRPEKLLADRLLPYAYLYVTIFLGWWLIGYLYLNPSRRWSPWREEAGRIAKAGLVVFIALGLIDFLARLNLSRLLLVGMPVAMVAALMAERLGERWVLAHTRKRGRNLRRALMVGDGLIGARFLDNLAEHPELGVRVIGFLNDEEAPDLVARGANRIGSIKDLLHVFHDRVVDIVIMALPLEHPEFQSCVFAAETEGKEVKILLSNFGARLAKASTSDFFGQALLSLSTGPRDPLPLYTKRTMDLLISGVGLLLTSPLLALVAVAIKLDSPAGSVFFVQNRLGLQGRPFRLIKFRTMVPEADHLKKSLRHLNEMSGPMFKIQNDPRVTRLGRFLRKYSLDELPQLWNVLKGEMSLVGPRPSLPDEVLAFEAHHRRRLSFRPGLTCLWQVAGRNQVDFSDWMGLDLEYVDRWSLGLDVQILARTLPAIFTSRGAS